MGIASAEKKRVMQDTPTTRQFFSGTCPIAEAVESLAFDAGAEQRGAIFTKREVVDFILDLVGYTAKAPLLSYKILEPSFGEGDFLFPIIDRLLQAAKKVAGGLSYEALAPTLRAVELHHKSFEATKTKVVRHLTVSGVASSDAARIASTWLAQDDFLLTSMEGRFSHIVGNPPYVRQENVADVLMAEYRKRFTTIYDRADLYIPFIERSLSLLDEQGKLSFICADRWMKNKYGSKLREYVSRDFSLTIFVDMFDTEAFHGDVSAYPAITVFERSVGKKTRVFARPQIDADFLRSLSSTLTAISLPKGRGVQEIDGVVSGSEPWVLESLDELALVRRLEQEYPCLEEVGCHVGIGVATGADRAFIGDFNELDVEASRKLPIVMTGDIDGGHVAWRGKGVINPFGDDGKLVDLAKFPRLKRHFELHRKQIEGRHIAEKNPNNWYRTIDRIYPALTYREKLLIPDIKGDAHIVHETGSYYPHHNLYFVTSDEWDMRALQMVLSSGIARLFVALYSTKMRGGYLRFQAQYLRRIRIPKWDDICEDVRAKLLAASKLDDDKTRNEVVGELYKLSANERALISRKYVYVS